MNRRIFQLTPLICLALSVVSCGFDLSSDDSKPQRTNKPSPSPAGPATAPPVTADRPVSIEALSCDYLLDPLSSPNRVVGTAYLEFNRDEPHKVVKTIVRLNGGTEDLVRAHKTRAKMEFSTRNYFFDTDQCQFNTLSNSRINYFRIFCKSFENGKPVRATEFFRLVDLETGAGEIKETLTDLDPNTGKETVTSEVDGLKNCKGTMLRATE